MQREIHKNTWNYTMLVDLSKKIPAQIAAYKAIKDEVRLKIFIVNYSFL